MSVESEQKRPCTQRVFNFRSEHGCCRENFVAYKASFGLEFIVCSSSLLWVNLHDFMGRVLKCWPLAFNPGFVNISLAQTKFWSCYTGRVCSIVSFSSWSVCRLPCMFSSSVNSLNKGVTIASRSLFTRCIFTRFRFNSTWKLHHFSNLRDNARFDAIWRRRCAIIFGLKRCGIHDPWSSLSCVGG